VLPSLPALTALLLSLTASPLTAQRGWDAQVHGQVLVRDSALAAVGVGGGLRLGGGIGVGIVGAWGWLAPDRAAGRVELVGAYHLPPVRVTQPDVYVSGGLAVEGWPDDVRGLLLLSLGVEARPWAGGGLFAEIGVGGGIRVAFGLRRIRLRR
jgi:hypothetical protein